MTGKKHFTSEQAKTTGEKLGINWSKYNVEQYRMGLDVELEHGLVDPHTNVTDDDPIMTGKIALAHLNEFPDYYTRLDKMEKEAEGKLQQGGIKMAVEKVGEKYRCSVCGNEVVVTEVEKTIAIVF